MYPHDDLIQDCEITRDCSRELSDGLREQFILVRELTYRSCQLVRESRELMARLRQSSS